MSMLRTVLRNLVSGPVTLKYPNAPANIPEGNRGRLDWDMEKCILCGLCQKRCPTLAVTMDKNMGIITLQVHRCISCGVCAEVCPKSAINVGREYSAPSYTKALRVYEKDMSKEKEKEGTGPSDAEKGSETQT